MSYAHEERFKNEAAIYSLRSEPGLQELRKWLYNERDRIGDKWVELSGDDLTRLQGSAAIVKRMIKLVDHGPTTRGEA